MLEFEKGAGAEMGSKYGMQNMDSEDSPQSDDDDEEQDVEIDLQNQDAEKPGKGSSPSGTAKKRASQKARKYATPFGETSALSTK